MRKRNARVLGVLFLAIAAVYAGPIGLDAQMESAAQTGASGQANVSGQTASSAQSGTKAPTTPAGAGYVTKARPVGQSTEDLLTQVQAANAQNRNTIAQAAQAAGVPVEPSAAAPEPAAPNDPFAPVVTSADDAQGSSVTADDVNVNTDSGTVEIHVNDANLVEVLRMLSMQSQKNIIASKEVKGTITANLYGVTVREALDALLKSNGYTYKEEGNFIYVYTVDEVKAMDAANRTRKTEVFRLHYVTAGAASVMLKPVLSEQGELAFSEPAETGIASGGSTGGNGMADQDVLVITDYEDRIEEVKRVVKEIDVRPQQILVEATILRATLKEDNALGVDFQVLGGVDFSTLTGAGSNFGGAASGQILAQSAGAPIVESGYGAVGTNFAGKVPAGGLSVGVAKNNIAIFLRALESVTDTAVVANPKVLALNKQKGEVFVGNDIGYRTTVTNENNTTSEQVEFLKTGTRLVFRPFIGNDGYIRMEIKPEDSSGNLQNGLPFKFTTEVTTNILVRDGHTIVIGGLFREDSNTTRGQVPGLGNVPIVGHLFKNSADATTREEIIVLLTPHIVKDADAFAQLGEEELDRVNQIRVGVRRGMMPWGRERLAEGAYDSALAEMAKSKPDTNAALWHLNVATNLNPKFIEAIELKQKLTGKQVSSADNSLVRSFVRKSILRDLDKTSKPANPVPAPVSSAARQPAAALPPRSPRVLGLLAPPELASVLTRRDEVPVVVGVEPQ
jgi:type IV pilus assembly protein PilQ